MPGFQDGDESDPEVLRFGGEGARESGHGLIGCDGVVGSVRGIAVLVAGHSTRLRWHRWVRRLGHKSRTADLVVDVLRGTWIGETGETGEVDGVDLGGSPCY